MTLKLNYCHREAEGRGDPACRVLGTGKLFIWIATSLALLAMTNLSYESR
jgi:hypothetical protein